MKLQLEWPAVVLFSVVFVTLGALVYFGKMPHEALGVLMAWLIPSPFQKKPDAPGGPPAALVALVVAGALTWSCSPTERERTKVPLELVGYQQALDDCREQGKASKSYEVYEACAKTADRKFGRDAGK